MNKPVLKLILVSAVAFAASRVQAADTPPARRPSLPVAGAITRPDWISRPSGDDVAQYYPQVAQQLGQPGLALIECSVTALGMMENCSTVEETPVGLGFGDASLRMASLFRMRPQTLDGAPVSGGVVRIPISFRLSDGDAPPPAPVAPPPTASALVLGKKLSAALRTKDQARSYFDRQVALAIAAIPQPTNQAEIDAQKAAQTALAESSQDYSERYGDLMTEIYARRFPEPQLTEIAAFFASPAGQAWLKAQPDIGADFGAEAPARVDTVGDDARRRFCAEVACGEFAPKPAPAAAAQGAKP